MASRSSRPVFSRTDPASNTGEASRISSAGSLERPRVGVTGVDQLEGGALESFGRAASGFLMFSPSAATPRSPGRTKRRADRRSVVLPAVVRLALVAARRFLQRARRSIRPSPGCVFQNCAVHSSRRCLRRWVCGQAPAPRRPLSLSAIGRTRLPVGVVGSVSKGWPNRPRPQGVLRSW